MDPANLVKKVTTPPKDGDVLEVDAQILHALKAKCKSDPDSIQQVFYYLSVDLAKRNGAVRYRALVAMDCLLHRSKVFRQLVCADIRTIATKMGLLKDSSAASASSSVPTGYAPELEAKSKELLELWDHLYGDRHPQLRAVARYLREFLGVPMPNILGNARQLSERTQRHKEHTRNIVLLQASKIIETEWSFYMPEWRRSVQRLQETFQLLFPGVGTDTNQAPTFEASTSAPAGSGAEGDDDSGIDWIGEDEQDSVEEGKVEVGGPSDSAGVPYTLTIPVATSASALETADNAVLLQQIREIAKHLARSAVPRLREWRELLAQAVAIYEGDARAGSDTASPTSESGNLQTLTADSGAAADASATATGSHPLPSGSGSVLGKRPTPAGTDDAVSTTAAASTVYPRSGAHSRAVDCLAEVEQLLAEVKALLTGRVRSLLHGEAL